MSFPRLVSVGSALKSAAAGSRADLHVLHGFADVLWKRLVPRDRRLHLQRELRRQQLLQLQRVLFSGWHLQRLL